MRFLRHLMVIAALGCALGGGSAQAADTNVTVDWSQAPGNATRLSYGVNLYQASDLYFLKDTRYANNLNFMKPGILRLHDIPMMFDAKAGMPGGNSTDTTVDNRGWIDNPGASNYSWDQAKILACMAKINNINFGTHDLLMNIPNWPSYLDDGTGKLRTDKYDEYAAWCAQLVNIVNHNGYYIKYWEPTNEMDSQYGTDLATMETIWLKCRNAMKNADNSIQVGGLAFANVYLNYGSNQQNFVKDEAGLADFYSVHLYGYGSSDASVSDSDAGVYGAADGIVNNAVTVLHDIRQSTAPNTPLFVDEYNLDASVNGYNVDTRQQNAVSAVFDALVQSGCVANGITGTMSWNEMDGWFGKTGGDYSLRPASFLYNLMNTYFIGQYAASTARNSDGSKSTDIRSYAIKSGNQGALMIINRSDNAHSVSSNLIGWTTPGSGNTYTMYQITNPGQSSSNVTYGSFTSGQSVPANSITVVIFSGVTFNGNRILINCAGDWDFSHSGSPFIADTNYTFGSDWGNPNSVSWAPTLTGLTNPAPNSIYQTYRTGQVKYVIPNMAQYVYHRLRVHFDEDYYYWNGARVFNIGINGGNWFTNLDPFTIGGGEGHGVIKQNDYVLADSNSNITITLSNGSADTPEINGIEIDGSTGGEGPTAGGGGGGGAYGGTPPSLSTSGTTKIEAENYDIGGEGVGYHDTNNGGNSSYRSPDTVGIETCSEGTYDVGWTANGEWLKYTVNVTTAGSYKVTFRISGNGGTLHLEDENGTNLTGNVTIPSTGGWQTWQDVTAPAFNLSTGTHVLKLVEDAAGYNINYLSIVDPPTGVKTNRATGGTATASSNPVSGEAAQYAFDGQTSTKWLGNMTSSGAWLQYQFGGGASYAINQYKITSANDDFGRHPKNWTLVGSNNGTTWSSPLDTQSNQSYVGQYNTVTYNFSNSTAYKYYRLNITANNGSTETNLGGTGLVQLAELQLLN